MDTGNFEAPGMHFFAIADACMDSLLKWHFDDAVVLSPSNSGTSPLDGRPWKPVSAFAKTKVCSFHLRGVCAHGERCTYAHDIGQLRVQPDLAKTRMCPRRCSAASCSFAHSREELRGTEDVYKTSLCRFWAAGRCSAGNQCRHAHGLDELRDTEVTNILEVPPGFDTL